MSFWRRLFYKPSSTINERTRVTERDTPKPVSLMSKEEIEKELREPDLEDGRRLELKSELANKVAQENAQKVVAQQASVTERTVRDQFVERTRKAVAAREEKEAAVREQRDAVKIALQEVNRWYSPSPPELAREAERAMKERADRDPPSRGGPGFSR